MCRINVGLRLLILAKLQLAMNLFVWIRLLNFGQLTRDYVHFVYQSRETMLIANSKIPMATFISYRTSIEHIRVSLQHSLRQSIASNGCYLSFWSKKGPVIIYVAKILDVFSLFFFKKGIYFIQQVFNENHTDDYT